MRQSLAVARNLIQEFFRMKALMIFTGVVAAFLTFGFTYWLHQSTGRADEKVQTFLSYSLSFTAGILSLMTIFVAIATTTRDLKRKQIFMVATKEISRGGYLAGKFLGMSLINLILLVVIGGSIYLCCRIMERTEPTNDDERGRLAELVFVARRSVQPELPDVHADVAKRVEDNFDRRVREAKMTDPMQMEAMRQAMWMEYYKQEIHWRRSALPGGYLTFHFKDIVPRDRTGNVYIRYKQDVSNSPVGEATFSQWAYGPKDPLQAGGTLMEPRRDTIRTVHEFPVPIDDAVSADGELYVTYNNPTVNAPTIVIYPPGTGIEALYVYGGFTGNFVRTLVAIYMRLLFLGMFSLAMAAWLSFPVAVLFTMVVFLMGVSSGFILESLDWSEAVVHTQITRTLLWLMPDFAAYDPVDNIQKGRLVSMAMLYQAFLFMVIVKGGLVSLFGYLIFKFRELARVIV